MPEEKKPSSSKRPKDDSSKRSSGSNKERSGSGRSSSEGSNGTSREDASKRAKNTAKVVGDGAGKAYDSLADCFGGEKELNRTIERYNPAFHEFAESTLLSRMPLTDKPSKLIFFLVAIALLQSFVPLFTWPLDLVARLLAFLFLYQSGLRDLRTGFSSSRSTHVKSLLTILLLTSALTLIPNFLFDTYYHFGAMWSFFLPVLLFITPWKGDDATLASLLADTVFASLGVLLESVVPGFLDGEQGQNLGILAGAVVALLFWVGYLGSTTAYLLSFLLLSFQTITALSHPTVQKEESSTKFYSQQNIWHNLLAIWLWRYLIASIEGVSIPGVLSVTGVIRYYLPSYFLWMTAFLFAMLMTKKVEKGHKANTWYAKWLLQTNDAASSTASSSSRSSSRSGAGSGSRERSAGSSSDPKKKSSSPDSEKRSSSDSKKKSSSEPKKKKK